MKALLGISALVLAAPAFAGSAVQVPYGTLKNGTQVAQTILRNDRGMEVRLIRLGAAITDIVVPDRNGRMANVNLGFGNLADWEAKNRFYSFGSVVGRYAGRIAGARFSLDGKEYRLNANDGPNALHGGGNGFDTKLWRVEPFMRSNASGAVMSYTSPAGEQNFPGKLDVQVTYTLTNDNALQLDYEVRTDAPTVFNLTNHSFFNLAGAGSGTVLDHQLQVPSDRYVEFAAGAIPTGAYKPVEGTPFDFRRPAAIRSKMDSPLVGAPGYNHSWWIPDQRGDVAKLAARVIDPKSGRTMDVFTTEPTVHAYVAGYFSGKDKGAQGKFYNRFDGIAMETQHLSNAPNDPRLPSTVLRPGEVYRSTTIYRFGVQK